MNRLAIAITLAAALPLAGCATPYGGSPGAWAYYDKNYAYGQKGSDRPVVYAAAAYSEAIQDRPYGNPSNSSRTFYNAQPLPDYAGEAERFAGRNNRCNCTRPRRTNRHGAVGKGKQNPSWTSTYYAIGP